eukprot:12895963-Prorocentrum_lima.AAC.1
MTSVPVLPCRRGQLPTLPVLLLVPGSGTDVGCPHRRRRLFRACHWGNVVQLAPTVAFDLALVAVLSQEGGKQELSSREGGEPVQSFAPNE